MLNRLPGSIIFVAVVLYCKEGHKMKESYQQTKKLTAQFFVYVHETQK